MYLGTFLLQRSLECQGSIDDFAVFAVTQHHIKLRYDTPTLSLDTADGTRCLPSAPALDSLRSVDSSRLVSSPGTSATSSGLGLASHSISATNSDREAKPHEPGSQGPSHWTLQSASLPVSGGRDIRWGSPMPCASRARLCPATSHSPCPPEDHQRYGEARGHV